MLKVNIQQDPAREKKIIKKIDTNKHHSHRPIERDKRWSCIVGRQETTEAVQRDINSSPRVRYRTGSGSEGKFEEN